MDTPKPELTFEESMKRVMKTLPPVIRDYLVQEKYTPVARSLMTKYGLRIDQGGVLEREILLLLMGVENPTEFTEALAEEAKLDKQTISGIVQDVNNQIFVPLRKKEEEKGGTTATEVRPSPQILKVEPQIQLKPEFHKVEPQIQPTTHFKLENKIPLAHSAPQSQKNEKSDIPAIVSQGSLPPKVFLPRPSTLGEVVRSVLAAPKPLDSNNLLEDHEEPHIEINKILVPQNLPGAMPEQVIPEVPIPEVRPSPILKVEPQVQPLPPKPLVVPVESKPVPLPAAPTAPVAPKPIAVAPAEPKSVPAPITSYSSDPYREPVDEPPTE